MSSRATVIMRGEKLYVKFNYYDADGTRRTLTRRALDRADADKIIRQLEIEHCQSPAAPLNQPSVAPPASSALTFDALATLYRKTKLIPARYVGEKKICGMRNPATPGYLVGQCERFFAARRIDSITPFDLSEFRLHLMNLPTQSGGIRSMAAVNRCLEQLRGVLRFAVKAGFLVRNPFDNAFEPLIVTSAENHRDRVLTFDEERRLLAAMDAGEQNFKRSHLKPLVIAALDTAARKNELMTLERRDINLTDGLITIRAINAKTGKARVLPITPRLAGELERLRNVALDGNCSAIDDHRRIFGAHSDIRRSFATVCRLAKIDDLHFHDLRHTAITRLVRAGVPASEVMKISGHSQMATFLRYCNPGSDALRSAGDALARLTDAGLFAATPTDGNGGELIN